jgi:hypothetical protein
MDTDRKNSAKVWYDILRIDDDQGSRWKIVMKDKEASRKRTHFLSLYPKIFDYSLGGYYHQERWPRTRWYYQIKLLSDDQRKGDLFEPILETSFLTIASGATPIGSAGRAPDNICTCIKRVKKAKEDLDNIITPIGREFILIKVE